VLHGGEPLLAGVGLVQRAVKSLRCELPVATGLDLTIQTNGVLLKDATLQALDALGVRVGVSLDGNRRQNDAHRVYRAGGTGSYDDVRRGLEALTGSRFRHLFAGLLCTIDPRHDPITVYEALLEFRPPAVDLLLPHRTWASPPIGSRTTPALGDPVFGRWLVAVFDHWYCTGRATRVRLFDDIIRLLLGGTARSDQVGLSPAAYVVIDTDGSFQQVDALKVVAAGAPETGLNVFDHTLDDVTVHPAVVARQIGGRALSSQCRACRLVAVCGGGHYTHRYRPGLGFRNPSVYCEDLQLLIKHIAHRIAA
jgi:uncharacterized protein